MKLGTIIAFCAGASVVIAGQRIIGQGTTGKSSARVSSEETCEALALLQTQVERPQRAVEPTQTSQASETAPVQAAPEVVADATPPGAQSPSTAESAPTAQSTPEAVAAAPSAETPTTDPQPEFGLGGVALPPVTDKVADDVRLHQTLDSTPSSEQPMDKVATTPAREPDSAALQTVVDGVREVGVRTEPAESDLAPTNRSVLNFAPPQHSEAEPAVETAGPEQEPAASPEPRPAEKSEPAPAADTPPQDEPPWKATSNESSTVRIAEKPVARNTPSGVPTAVGDVAANDTISAEEMEALKQKIHRVLDFHRDRMLNTRDHGAWEIMHSFIAYGIPKEVQIGGPGGRRVNAIGWLAFNGPSAGERLFTAGNAGPRGRLGPGLQGHEGQFMAMLAQSRVEPNYPMKVEGRDFTVEDLVKQEQATCRAGTELTFKLIGLMHYLKSDTTWRDDAGGEWDIPRLVKEELSQPIIGATCGGTHRLFGLTYSYKKRQQRGEPVSGQYRRAQIYVKDFQEYTFKMQNPDGSFSTAFFAGRGALPDPQRRLETTGHIAEWLTFSLDDNQLRQPRMVKGISYLATLLDENRDMSWKVGPLGHALHALNMYDSSVFGGTAYPWPMAPAPQTAASAAP